MLAGVSIGVSGDLGVSIAAWAGVGTGTVEDDDGEAVAPPIEVGETADGASGAGRGSDTSAAVGSGVGRRFRVGNTVSTKVFKDPASNGIGVADVEVEAGDAVGRRSGVEAVPHPANQNIITTTIKEIRSGSLIDRFYQIRCNEAGNGR